MEARNKFKKMIAKRNCDESGYALILVLGIVILTIGILSSMTLLTVNDVKNSTKNRGVLEARIAGESALDSLYASMNTNGVTLNGDDSINIVNALQKFNDSNGKLIVDTTLDGTSISPNVTKQNYKWAGWFGIDRNGTITPCNTADNTTPCFKLKLIRIVTTPDYTVDNLNTPDVALVKDISATREEFVVDIVTRTRCDRNTTNNCSYSRIQQNISLRKYVEYVSMNVSEKVKPALINAASLYTHSGALNPSYSYDNYYSGRDIVAGKIHTNSEIIKACNGFNTGINNWLTAKGTATGTPGQSSSGVFPTSTAGCNSGPTGTNTKKATRLPLALPDRAGDTNADGLKAIAQSDGSQYVIPTNSSVVFAADGTLKIDGAASIQMPPSGVLFFNEGGSIRGTVKGNITIASAGGKDIKIDGDLLSVGISIDPITRSWIVDPQYLIGVYSGKDIVFACGGTSPPNSPCATRNVSAFLKANTDMSNPAYNANWGTIYVDYWDRADSGCNYTIAPGCYAPTFNFFGAMESYYRGTFGTMDSTSDGPRTGYRKNFYFDKRLLYQQPPFMLRDGSVPFIRNAVKDLPCGNPTVCNNSI